MQRATLLVPPPARWLRGETSTTWILLVLVGICLLACFSFFIASTANAKTRRERQEELTQLTNTYNTEKKELEKQLGALRTVRYEEGEAVDQEADQVREAMIAERAKFREVRSKATRAESEVAGADRELNELEDMERDLRAQIERLRADLPEDVEGGDDGGGDDGGTGGGGDDDDDGDGDDDGGGDDGGTRGGDDGGDDDGDGGDDGDGTPEPGAESGDPAERIIQEAVTKIALELEERDLLVTADHDGPMVIGDGLHIRDLDQELRGASTEERLAAANRVRLAGLSLQQHEIWARVALKKLKQPRFESETFKLLQEMQSKLEGN